MLVILHIRQYGNHLLQLVHIYILQSLLRTAQINCQND